MKTEVITLNESRNVTLTTYIQAVGGEFGNIVKRPAMLVIPGGGYQFCSDREAEPVAMPYLKAGFQVFILRYSVKQDAIWPNPLEDYEQAMELIRSKEEEWKLYPDKVAVIGFSAGGHLAGCAATMSRNRPNAAVLGYAVLGEDVKGCNPSAPDSIAAVTVDTCPCFLFSTRTDNVVPIDNSTRFMTALAEAGVAFESHIYSYGPHGFSTCDSSVQSLEGISVRAPQWVDDSIGWLKEILGDFADGCMSQPKCPLRVNEDHQPWLSVDCSMKLLQSNPHSKGILDYMFQMMQSGAASNYADNPLFKSESDKDGGEFNALSLVTNMRLRDVLNFGQVPENVIEDINTQLQKIENK